MENPLQMHTQDGQDKLAAILACIPFLFWVPHVMGRTTSFVSHYMKHGFAFTVVSIIFQLLTGIFGFLYFLLYPVGVALNFVIFVSVIYMIYHAFIGKIVTIPYITDITNKGISELGIQSWFQSRK
jgi:uncharacterized membrane protein